MIGYIKRDVAAQECERLHAINSGFFSSLIKQLPDEDFWFDAKENPPVKSGEYIVSAYNKIDNKWHSFGTFYEAQFNEWSVECECDYEVYFWANYPEPKTKDDMGEQ